MAIKPTIYKFKISLSDLNNDHFDSLNLTVAQHPSETLARMMARVLAFCLHAHQDEYELLAFTKGLSSVEEPDIWLKGLDDQLHMWIDVGEPAFERMKKASRLAKSTFVYTFNSKSDVWWKQSQAQFEKLDISVTKFEWEEIQQLTQLVDRTVELAVTITGQSAYVAGTTEQVEVNWSSLQ
jgi:uncharacterized protein YaeQ